MLGGLYQLPFLMQQAPQAQQAAGTQQPFNPAQFQQQMLQRQMIGQLMGGAGQPTYSPTQGLGQLSNGILAGILARRSGMFGGSQ